MLFRNLGCPSPLLNWRRSAVLVATITATNCFHGEAEEILSSKNDTNCTGEASYHLCLSTHEFQYVSPSTSLDSLKLEYVSTRVFPDATKDPLNVGKNSFIIPFNGDKNNRSNSGKMLLAIVNRNQARRFESFSSTRYQVYGVAFGVAWEKVSPDKENTRLQIESLTTMVAHLMYRSRQTDEMFAQENGDTRDGLHLRQSVEGIRCEAISFSRNDNPIKSIISEIGKRANSWIDDNDSYSEDEENFLSDYSLGVILRNYER